MSEQAIKIRIAERDYPMRVSAEEEERLRAAGRVLNERIKLFREQFGLQDQDLLAMIALESVADRLLAEQRLGAAGSDVHQRLEHLYEVLLTASTGPVGASGSLSVSSAPSSGLAFPPSQSLSS